MEDIRTPCIIIIDVQVYMLPIIIIIIRNYMYVLVCVHHGYKYPAVVSADKITIKCATTNHIPHS